MYEISYLRGSFQLSMAVFPNLTIAFILVRNMPCNRLPTSSRRGLSDLVGRILRPMT